MKNLTVIWDHRGDEIAFDVVYNGKRWADHNRAGTPEGVKFAADVAATARRFGDFMRINASQCFRTATTIKGDEQARLIDAFQRQGYKVEEVGRKHPAPPEDRPDWTAEAKPQTPTRKPDNRPMPTPSGSRARLSVKAPALAYGM